MEFWHSPQTRSGFGSSPANRDVEEGVFAATDELGVVGVAGYLKANTGNGVAGVDGVIGVVPPVACVDVESGVSARSDELTDEAGDGGSFVSS